MNTIPSQLTYIFSDILMHRYRRIADPNHLLADGGLLSKYWNFMYLPDETMIDTWDSDDAVFLPLHTAMYHRIYEQSLFPETVYDVAYCIGSPHTDYSLFFDFFLSHSKNICLDADALYEWELMFGEHNECTLLRELKGSHNYVFETLQFFNYSLQNYLSAGDTDAVLNLFHVFSPIVRQSFEYNLIGMKFCLAEGLRSQADFYLQQAYLLDPENSALLPYASMLSNALDKEK